MSLSAERDDLERELRTTRSFLDQASQELVRVQNELNLIYTSRAWTLISGIRAVKRALTGRSTARPESRPPITDTSKSHIPESPSPSKPSPARDYEFTVSVVIPVYNKGWDLIDAIESVKSQTLADVEIVVWNDGSTDPSTLEALEAASRIDRVAVFDGPNRGLSTARNSGIAVSRGRLLCCLDPDDQFYPTYLEKAAAILLAHPDVAIAYPWVHTVGDKEEVWRTMDLDPELILDVNHVAVCAMYKREVFEATGGYKREMREGYEDWEFWAHAAELGFSGRVIREPLFRYSFSEDPEVSMHRRAMAVHEELLERMRGFHPTLANGTPLLTRSDTETIESSEWAGIPRFFAEGRGRPVIVTIPWFTVGGGDRVVEALLGHWKAQDRTAIVLTTNSPGDGMVDRFPELLELTPYAYSLPALLPESHWEAFVAGILKGLNNPTILNVGSQWLYRNLESLKHSPEDLRVVDQQFNDVGHFAANLEHSDLIDVTVTAHAHLQSLFLDKGVEPERVKTVYVGVAPPRPNEDRVSQLRQSHRIPENARVVLHIGRFSEEKRTEWIVRLAEQNSMEDVWIVIVGDGPLAGDLAPRIEAANRTVWLKHLPAIGDAYGLADLFVLSSKVEGIPLTVMEALAAGVPCVAPGVGGIPELADHRGLELFDSSSYQEFDAAVKRSLSTVVEDVQLHERFTLDTMLSEYDQLVDPASESTSSAID